jgi:dihydrolipoamide dehydrogenase
LDVRVPDIGDFTDVPVVEILVSVGDEVEPETPLVTLESDKASMDVPSPAAGAVKQLAVKVGDRVSEGSVLLTLDAADGGESAAEEKTETSERATPAPGTEEPPPAATATLAEAEAEAPESKPKPKPAAGPPPDADVHGEVVVLGSGPGGYNAAFRAADLGLKTVLIERHSHLGGVCLNVGCIPSKALLHMARVLAEAEEAAEAGIAFAKPKIDIAKLVAWKQSVVDKLTGGLDALAKQRKVEVVRGTGRFAGERLIEVEGDGGTKTVAFDNCVIAAGSSAATIPGLPEDDRLMDSTGALEITDIPAKLLVIGGGIIGLEMATVYDALGSKVTVVEMLDALIPGCDPDLVRPLRKRIDGRYEAILLGTKVAEVKAQKNGLKVSFEGGEAPKPTLYDRILVAVGRRPNGKEIAAEKAGVEVDDAGFISVDKQMKTKVANIYAIGDIVGEPMLAHKASHEGKAAAEVIAGQNAAFDPRSIPSVAYTDPEVAWTGLTETDAKASGVDYEKAVFSWAASGRALSLGRDEGQTKLLFEPGSKRLLGVGIVGVNAGELIAETVHALEMGSDAADIGLTIHPHPTLSESVGMAAEMAEGTITDLMPPKQKKK